jgi:hypothetical protein
LSLAERIWAVGLAVVAALFRFVTPLFRTGTWNLSPVGAVGIYGGSRLGGWLAFVLPLGIMAVSDAGLWLLFGNRGYDPMVYLSFLIYVALGYFLLQNPSILRVGGVTVLGSVQFYLLTNFLPWLQSCAPAADLGGLAVMELPSADPLYPYPRLVYSADLKGLLASYWMGLPFFRNTLIGDLVFTYALFGLHRWLIEPAKELEPGGVPVREQA